MERITVVKIGGNVIDNPAALKRFLGEFAALEGPKILVHGGGKLATRLAERLELKVQMVDGRRITDKGTLDVVTMVYAGLINKQVVAGLRPRGATPSGCRGPTATPSRPGAAAPSRSTTDSWATSNGWTPRCCADCSKGGIVPVFSAIMHDGRGTLLNCNADSVASAVALGAAEIAPDGPGFLLRESRGSARPGRRHDADPPDHGRNLSAASRPTAS